MLSNVGMVFGCVLSTFRDELTVLSQEQALAHEPLQTEFFHDVITPVSFLVSPPQFLSLITGLSLRIVVLGWQWIRLYFLKYTFTVPFFLSSASLTVSGHSQAPLGEEGRALAVDLSAPLATESPTRFAESQTGGRGKVFL